MLDEIEYYYIFTNKYNGVKCIMTDGNYYSYNDGMDNFNIAIHVHMLKIYRTL